MAETKPRVMDLVRKELVKDPSISSEALYQKAKKVDRSIGSLSIRQFHARYPLQVKRISAADRKRRGGARKATTAKSAGRTTTGRKSARKTRKTGRRGARKRAASRTAPSTRRAAPQTPSMARRSAGTDSRSAVRSILLEFAREVAAAEGKADIIGVVGRVDTWVDRVQKAAS